MLHTVIDAGSKLNRLLSANIMQSNCLASCLEQQKVDKRKGNGETRAHAYGKAVNKTAKLWMS